MSSLITRLRQANHEQRKLILSIATSFLTRVPGAVGLLWLLPMVHASAGTDDYGILLSSSSLGYAAAFLCGGVVLIGRRLIGEAYAAGKPTVEADSFVSLVIANTLSVVLAVSIVAVYCLIYRPAVTFVTISLLSAAGFIFIMFDNTRSAYNEHYISAVLLIICQSTTFAIGFLVPQARESIILAFLVFQSPYWLTGAFTFGLLLPRRTYLLYGRPTAVGVVFRQGTMFALADGFLMATLSLSVVWLQATASAETSAWFATLVRLFQTLLVPVTLLLLPLSSYIRIRWNGKSISEQQTFTMLTLLIGIAYGVVVAIVLVVASRLYIGHLLGLPTPADPSVFLFFAAIIAYKSYSSIAYLVLDETMHLAVWISIAVGLAVAVAAVASVRLDPLSSINVYAVASGLLVIGVTSWNALRFVRPASA